MDGELEQKPVEQEVTRDEQPVTDQGGAGMRLLQVGDRQVKIDATAHRYVTFDRAAVDQESRTVTMPVSSEFPVERWWGTEVLMHDAASVDLSRLKDGGILLYSHDRDEYIGVIEDAYVSNRKMYCRARFDNHELAERIWNSVSNGILRNVSIGYMIQDMREEVKDKQSTYYATRWTPYEVSIVTIPADPTVGVGRSLENDVPPPEPEQQISTPVVEESIQEDERSAEVEESQPIIAVTENRMNEKERILSIQALCRMHNMPESLAQQMIEEDKTIDEARAIVLDKLRGQTPQEPVAKPVNALGLTEKEQRQYSVCKAILAQVDPNLRDQAGFEREISDEIAKKLGKSTSGFYIPVRDLRVPWMTVTNPMQQRATYAVGAAATGGVTVETMLDAASLIDFLRNRAMVMRMGARMLSGLTGILDIPRQTGVAATYWVGEGGTVSQSESTFDKLTFTPKTVGVKSRMTRLMLLQSSLDIEAFVRQDISQSIALEIDRVTINGSGTSNQPAGLLSAGVNLTTVALGTNGAAPTWDAVVQCETTVASLNADIGALGFMTTPQVRGKLKRTLKNPTASNSDWIWENGSDPLIGNLNGYMAGVTNQVPSNLTKGTGTNLSAMIFGNWNDVMIGEWGVLELLANPYGAGYDSGDVEVRAMQTIDVQIRRSSSFVKIVDCLTT